MSSLFVYGTLCPGKPNAHILENIGGSFKKAYIFGTLYNADYAVNTGYPGVVLEGNEQVNGFIFNAENLDSYWNYLDEFEGLEYQRVPVKVFVEDGEEVDSFVYILK